MRDSVVVTVIFSSQSVIILVGAGNRYREHDFPIGPLPTVKKKISALLDRARPNPSKSTGTIVSRQSVPRGLVRSGPTSQGR